MKTNTQTKNALGGLMSGLLEKSAKMLAVLALSLTAISSHAITYDYSYTFGNGLVVSGSLDGDLNGDFVENVTNVSVFYDGTPMLGTVFTAKYDGVTPPNGWVNGPIVSFDVFQNNFMFINSDYVSDDHSFDSFIYILNGSVYSDTAFAYSVPLGVGTSDNPTEQARWSLTAQSIPDGGATMPLLGLACVGLAWFNRRRSVSV